MARGEITAMERQKRNRERVNVYIDGEFAFGLAVMEAARLQKGQILSEDQITALRGEDAVQRAVDRAARFLAHRPRSRSEIQRNLTGKGIDGAVAEAAIERLAALGYVDDLAFARFWIQNREAFKPLGAVALRYELRQKGIADDLIDAALEGYDGDDAAYRAARGRARRLRGMTRREFHNRIGGFLQRRGFAYDVARAAVERLIGELEGEEGGFFQADPDG